MHSFKIVFHQFKLGNQIPKSKRALYLTLEKSGHVGMKNNMVSAFVANSEKSWLTNNHNNNYKLQAIISFPTIVRFCLLYILSLVCAPKISSPEGDCASFANK